MAKAFSTLRAGMPAPHQARAAERTAAMLAEMPLQELRQARQLSQETLGSALGPDAGAAADNPQPAADPRTSASAL